MPNSSSTTRDDVTRLIQDVNDGREGAMDELMDAVYADLERVAEGHMRRHFGPGLPGVTLEPAALVNDSFLRLIRQRNAYDNRGHFFAIATKVMLRVLVDYERRRRAAKRGGGAAGVAGVGGAGEVGEVGGVTVWLDRGGPAAGDPDRATRIEIPALVTALDKLEALDARKADVVKLRVVWGLEMREIAAALDVSLATVERDWAFSKAWLAREASRVDEG